MNALLEQFLAETKEGLQSIGEKLLELEREPDSKDLINELFRLVHTLKGNSGLFDFPEMTRVLHAGEDLMDAVRNDQVNYSDTLADRLLDMVDFISMLSDEIADSETISSVHMEPAKHLTQNLRALIQHADDAGGDACGAENTNTRVAMPALQDIDDDIRLAWAEELTENNPHHWVEYTPEPGSFFKGEDPFYLFRQVPKVQWCKVVPAEPFPAPAELDPYHCNLKFQAVSSAELSELQEMFRYVPEQVIIQTIAVDDLLPPPAHTPAGVDHTQIKHVIESQLAVLSLADNADWRKGRLLAAANTVKACLLSTGKVELQTQIDHALQEGLADNNTEALQAICRDVLQSLRAAPNELPGKEDAPAAASDKSSTEPVKTNKKSEEGQGSAKTLKVDQNKIDHLMSLIGEIVVAKNSLPYLANRAENHYGSREMAREIKAQYAVINRIAEEMQDAIMQVRMMPVSFVLQRFPRLVRDLSKKLGKEVQLVMEGEDTEIDKNIVEALADPLIHIVRNSLDHGLEMPEVRRKAGKATVGRITIKAKQESDRVFIDISDDGKGVDPQIIKMKAYEKGLIDEATLERISDQDAVNLIFAAGFSTSETVSDLSGRGVGMDVVRNAIEKVNGSVSLQSQVGKGTQLRLSLPLSMAVTNVMIVESNQQIFGIPMESVVETVRLAKTDIHGIKQHKTAVLRGEVIPLLELNQLLGINQEQVLNEDQEIATLVIRHEGENVGVVVDDFRETVDIILKPMTGILASLGVYSGSALMGDGSVLMVLNPRELI